MFVGRVRELARLREEFAADRPSLLVVFGRRRVGKSELLRKVTRNIPHVMYQATRVSSSLNLEALKAEVARSLGADDLLQGLGDWLGVRPTWPGSPRPPQASSWSWTSSPTSPMSTAPCPQWCRNSGTRVRPAAAG